MGIEGDSTDFPITEIAFKDNILPILVQEKLVGWDEKDELNIIYEGIYRVSEHYFVPRNLWDFIKK